MKDTFIESFKGSLLFLLLKIKKNVRKAQILVLKNAVPFIYSYRICTASCTQKITINTNTFSSLKTP